MKLYELACAFCFHEDELLEVVPDESRRTVTVSLLHGEEPDTQPLFLRFRGVSDFYSVAYDNTAPVGHRHADGFQHEDGAYTFILSSTWENGYLRLFCETTEHGHSFYQDIFISAAEAAVEAADSAVK